MAGALGWSPGFWRWLSAQLHRSPAICVCQATHRLYRHSDEAEFFGSKDMVQKDVFPKCISLKKQTKNLKYCCWPWNEALWVSPVMFTRQSLATVLLLGAVLYPEVQLAVPSSSWVAAWGLPLSKARAECSMHLVHCWQGFRCKLSQSPEGGYRLIFVKNASGWSSCRDALLGSLCSGRVPFSLVGLSRPDAAACWAAGLGPFLPVSSTQLLTWRQQWCERPQSSSSVILQTIICWVF